MLVRDIMTCPVITVGADTPVDVVARLLAQHRIGGVPVVDERQAVIGIVTETDLFLKEKPVPFSAEKLPALYDTWVDPAHLPETYSRARRYTAADVMTSPVISVEAGDNVGQAAALMVHRGLRRVPVLLQGQLVGIVTRADILKLLAELPA